MTDDHNESPPQPVERRGGDGRYLALVAGLLIVIIGVLAALWQRERSAAAEAMRELSQLRTQQQRLRLANQIMGSEQVGRIQPLQRDEWTLGQATVDGQTRQVFYLDVRAARRFGLAAGDVAIVLPRDEVDANAPDANAPSEADNVVSDPSPDR
ncbi:MAG: hypothetical protein ACOCZU_06375 [Planctomycetota bacterium]